MGDSPRRGFVQASSRNLHRMSEDEEDEGGAFAVPGEESSDRESTLSPDDGGDDPQEPPSEPKQPSPAAP
jgi:hypothetical protein